MAGLEAEEVHVGVNADAATYPSAVWVGLNGEVTTAQVALTYATAERDAAQSWLDEAELETLAAAADVTRAQELLMDLVREIAPLARAEISARTDLKAA